MMYHGKLYGKLWNKYFDTDHTTDEWDAMEKQIKELKAEIETLRKANGVSTGERQSNIPDVSQQRELLYGFATWHNSKPQKKRYDMIYVSEVEEFLKP